MIVPYCMLFSLDADYLNDFEPENGEAVYTSYDDFFKRKFRNGPEIQAPISWPCEGYICDWGSFNEKQNSLVKGQLFDLNKIFLSTPEQTENYFFTNIFLHNHNYHHVHAPVSGKIIKITKIPGDLIFLRPWFYQRSDVSYPALRNERVIFELLAEDNKVWYLAMVGGFGVGSIEMKKDLALGSTVQVGEEIAKFNLGSTVCLASPVKISVQKYLQTIVVGQKIEIKS